MEVQDNSIHSESFHGLDPNSVLHGELDVQVVDYATQLLRAQYITIHGLLPPSHLYGLERARHSTMKIPQNMFAVQIHIIPGHYLVSTQINGSVILIDSLYHWSHRGAVMGQLKILYEENAIASLQYVSPQSQGASNLCGFFSLAFVHSLISNRCIPNEMFEMSLMRQHLRRCLTDGIMLPFPVVGEVQQQKQADADLLNSYFSYQKQMNEKKTISANVPKHSNTQSDNNNQHDKTNRHSMHEKDRYNNKSNRRGMCEIKNSKVSNFSKSRNRKRKRKSKSETKQVKVCDLNDTNNKNSNSVLSNHEKCQQHEKLTIKQTKRKGSSLSNETNKCKRQMYDNCTDKPQNEISSKKVGKRQKTKSNTDSDSNNLHDKTIMYYIHENDYYNNRSNRRAMNETKNNTVSDLNFSTNNNSNIVSGNHKICQQHEPYGIEQIKRKGTSVSNEADKSKRQMYDKFSDEPQNKISGKNLTKRQKYKLKLDKQKVLKQQKRLNCKSSVESVTISCKKHVKNEIEGNTKNSDCDVWLKAEKDKNRTANKICKRNSRRNLSEIQKFNIQLKDKLDHRTSRSALSKHEKLQLQQKNKSDHRRSRSTVSEHEKLQLQQKNKLDHRRSRSMLSEHEKLQLQQKNKLDHRKSRSMLSEHEKLQLQEKNKLDQRRSRSALSEHEKLQLQQKNKSDHRRSRSMLREHEKLQLQQKNKLDHRTSRSALSEHETLQLQQKNKLDHRTSRSALSEHEKVQLQEKNKLDHRSSRSAISEHEKNTLQLKNKLEHRQYRKTRKEQREDLFQSYHTNSSPSHEAVDHILEIFFKSISDGPIFNCCSCNRYMYRSSVKKLNVKLKNAAGKICNFHLNNTDDETVWICDTCSSSIQKKKLPSQAVSNNLTVDKVPEELQNMSHLEKQLVGKIIPFMKIVSLPAGSQHGLKGQVVLVPANIQKTVTSLPHQTGESQIIALSLKRRLTDKYGTTRQYIRPNIVNQAFKCLKVINTHYEDIPFNENWIAESEANDKQLWKCVSEENTTVHDISQDSYASSSDTEINEDMKNNENTLSSSGDTSICEGDNKQDLITDSEDEVDYSNPVDIVEDITYKRSMNSITCIYPEFGPSLQSDKVLNLAPGEGQVPVSALFEKDWETLAFPTLFPTGKDTFHEKREVQVSPKKYVIARLLSKDSRFAESAEYTFQCLHWIESVAVNDSISISLKKSRQSDLTAGQLQNPDRLKSLFKDDEIYASFKKIRGTPQYWKEMQQNMLAKIRHFGTYTFFLSGSAADFHWPELIQIVAKQYGENYDIDYIENEMDKKKQKEIG